MKKSNALALIPIGVFVVFYLTLGIVFEYVMKISMGFYSVPVVVAFLVALFVAVLQTKGKSLDEKFEIMGQGVGDKNIVTMLLIFMLAGIFVGVVGRSSAESVAYFMLSVTPPRMAVVVIFIVSCFVSTAMGTSVGTITLLTPIAVAIAEGSGFSLPLCVGTVVGGAMFGDNLSFISDTTIAACNGQGCKMKDKFRTNFLIVVPAAVVSLGQIFFMSMGADISEGISKEYDMIQVIPYVLVLLSGIFGVNVFLTLIIGILSGSIIMLATGAVDFPGLLSGMGAGASGMFETSMVAILVAALGALIKHNGGFEALLNGIRKVFKGRRGGQLGIGLLVGLMDIATANNTVAIVMANPIASEMSKDFGISKRKTASLLDTFSCIVQGFLPYGAQILVAISAVNTLGGEISAFDIITNMVYPMMLLASSLVFIFLFPEKKEKA
ncbi:MAG: Na+/H+ antiporter NhaC family protein [Clostridia bacterium]|nr:Na+/H+ antiporter NhaC family protein [Oscillospiraceae bacterium]MBQ7004867.1 Na+/H+ antiporter NhaC family protein [Clostridia bacterium]